MAQGKSGGEREGTVGEMEKESAADGWWVVGGAGRSLVQWSGEAVTQWGNKAGS